MRTFYWTTIGVDTWLSVRENGGAAGVDGQTIEQFEANLSPNLYKLWNRMASGSYHPKTVRRVDIPKKSGGTRPLGIPTIAAVVSLWTKKGESMSILQGTQVELSDLLLRGGSWHNIPGKDAADFIIAALTAMSEPGQPDRRILVAPMIAREAASPTALGDALAFPHPLADGLGMGVEPFVAIAYPRFPVAWGAPDGIPVRAAFFVVCSDRHNHLLTLSALAKHCSREEVRTALMEEATASELATLMVPLSV